MEQYLDNLAEFLVCAGILSFIFLILIGILKLGQWVLRLLGWEEPVLNFIENLFNEPEDGNNK